MNSDVSMGCQGDKFTENSLTYWKINIFYDKCKVIK
ncbi:hypothetical protein X975_22605, partial [Stegodyphus mimosarum]